MAKHKRRAKRRNSFKGHSKMHRRAALKRFRNPKHRKGRKGYRRSFARNPMAAISDMGGGFVRSATSAFSLDTLKKGGVVVGGIVANEYASDYLGIGLEKLVPSVNFSHGVPSYLCGLVSAGLLGFGAKKVAPQYAGMVFLGGVIDVLKKVADDYVVPHLPHMPVNPMNAPAVVAAPAPVVVHPAAGVSGMSDYLTPQGAATARALHGMSDYLTPQGAATARALHGMGDFASMAVASELETM